MVVLDATTLLLLLHPNAKPPIDPLTDAPLTLAKERVQHLLERLSEGEIRVMIPTPVLAEVLVAVGSDKQAFLSQVMSAYAFRIEPFDVRAAVEVSVLTDVDLQSGRPIPLDETKAKVKFDRQIIAIALVHGVKTIYSDDRGLAKRAEACGLVVIPTYELPAPPTEAQPELPFDSGQA